MKIDVAHWDTAVGELYESVLNPSLLQPALIKANHMLDSDLCHMVGFNARGEENFRLLTQDGMEQVGDLYASYYNRIDPRRRALETAPVGQTFQCAAYFDQAYVDRDEFYQDFLIPQGFRHVIGACLQRSAEQHLFVAFNHGAGRPGFTDDEQQFFDRYNTHLRRVMDSVMAHAPVASALASESALQALQYGVMALDASAQIVYSNRLLESMYGNELHNQMHHGQLAEDSELALLCRRLLQGGPASSLRLLGAGGAQVFVSGLRTSAGRDAASPFGNYLSDRAPSVVLIFSRGNDKPSASPSQLMHMFTLSPAEARLAYELSNGATVNDYAERYSVSVATARTQLRAVLRKTGASRQQDLVRILASLPRGAS
ncbi:MAG: hypothetical protein V4484_00635 [Pseudomonadota bacterium]